MENKGSGITRRLGIAATVVTLAGGSLALWDKLKPEEEVPDIGGRWTITNTVTASDGDNFNGEVYVYSIGVARNADSGLSGEGDQTLYKKAGAEIGPAPSRFPVRITDGEQTEGRLRVNLSIKGKREFTGTLWLNQDDSDPTHWVGTFEYTAGGTKGTSEVWIKS